MKNISMYLDFLKEKGKPLSEINPGSDEIALTVNDALQALELLIDSQTAILGGDILSEENNELAYAYQLWGEEYQYLNWHCDKNDNESKADYLQRSYVLAREAITNANKTAEKLKKKCYIVFVTEKKKQTVPCPFPVLSPPKRSNIRTGTPMSFWEESRVGGFIFWRFGLPKRIQNNVSLWTRAEETIGHQGMYNGNISWMETNLSKFGKQAMLYAMGNRIAKIVSTPTKNDTAAYVRDASGNVMTVYKNRAAAEAPIYGSGRIGEYMGKEKEGYQTFNLRKYELANHLGNVLAVISDKVNLYGHNNILDSARATVMSASDYYPFGLPMKGRGFNDNSYRYGYNKGSEKDAEIYRQSGRAFTTKFREGDTYLGRWWSTDPEQERFSGVSPYVSMDNSPIFKNDPAGDIWDTVLDIAFLIYDLGEIAYDYVDKGKVDPVSFAALSADAVATLVPFATGAGLAVRAGKAGVKVAEHTTPKVIKQTAKQVEKNIATKAEQLAKNKAQGVAKEKVVKGQLEKELKPNEELLEQTSHKMEDGKRSRPDFTVVNKGDKSVVKIVDAKSGKATKTSRQKALEQKGGTLTGKKAGAYKGTSTPPMKIETR